MSPTIALAIIGTALQVKGQMDSASAEKQRAEIIGKQNTQNARQVKLSAIQEKLARMEGLDAYAGALQFVQSVNMASSDRQINAFMKSAETKTANDLQQLRANTLFQVGRIGLSTRQAYLTAESAQTAALYSTGALLATRAYQYDAIKPGTTNTTTSTTSTEFTGPV